MEAVEVILVVNQKSHLDVRRLGRLRCLLKGRVVCTVVNCHQLGENDVASIAQVPRGHLATMATGHLQSA